MNVREYYSYLSAARAQLWNFLRALPPADLDRDLIEVDLPSHYLLSASWPDHCSTISTMLDMMSLSS